MIAEVHLINRGRSLELHDGDEDNPEHVALAEAVLTVKQAFGGYLHGFDASGKAVVVPERAIDYVRILEP